MASKVIMVGTRKAPASFFAPAAPPRRAELGDRELGRVQLVSRRHGPTRGHHLDLVNVAAELLADRLAHLRLAVGDGADHADAAVDGPDPFGAASLVAVGAGLGEV